LIWWPFIFLHESGKAVEAFGPEALVAIEPVHRLLHRPGGQPARHDAAGFRARDQAGIRQHVEMLHDRGQRHRERLRQLAHRNAVLSVKPGQQCASRRVRERGEGTVQEVVSILNHVV
jgi:hypothetical protein